MRGHWINFARVERTAHGSGGSQFSIFADYISQRSGERYDQTPGYMTTVVREPVGVAALIAPWNAPVALATMKIAASLSFGNTCVLKPSEQTPLALARLVALLQDVLPDGVLTLVNGRGPTTGAALVDHHGIDLVSFTGGTETGRTIMSAAGRRLCQPPWNLAVNQQT